MRYDITLILVDLDFYLCKDCAWTNEYPEGNGHFWWHILLPFDFRNLPIDGSTTDKGLSAPDSSSEAKADVIPVDGDRTDTASLSINSLLPSDTSAALPEIFDPSSVASSRESIKELGGKMSRLESEVGQRMNAVEARLTGVEEKLDTMVVELKKVMEALLSSRS